MIIKKETDADCVAKIAKLLIGEGLTAKSYIAKEDALHIAAKAYSEYWMVEVKPEVLQMARNLINRSV